MKYSSQQMTNDICYLPAVTYEINIGSLSGYKKNLLGSVFQYREAELPDMLQASLVVQADGMLITITITTALSKMHMLCLPL